MILGHYRRSSIEKIIWKFVYLYTAVQNKLWTFNRSLIIKDLGQAFTYIQNVVGL